MLLSIKTYPATVQIDNRDALMIANMTSEKKSSEKKATSPKDRLNLCMSTKLCTDIIDIGGSWTFNAC